MALVSCFCPCSRLSAVHPDLEANVSPWRPRPPPDSVAKAARFIGVLGPTWVCVWKPGYPIGRWPVIIYLLAGYGKKYFFAEVENLGFTEINQLNQKSAIPQILVIRIFSTFRPRGMFSGMLWHSILKHYKH